MTSDLDALPFASDDEPTARSTVSGKPRAHRHVWYWSEEQVDPQSRVLGMVERCKSCRRLKDLARTKLGKSSRRLGNDQERRAERRYGWEKIGERGQMTDLRGKLMKVQMKASRRKAPALFRTVFPALDQSVDGRIPAILLSYVKAGVGTEDFIVIRGSDWLDLHGRDEPEDSP